MCKIFWKNCFIVSVVQLILGSGVQTLSIFNADDTYKCASYKTPSFLLSFDVSNCFLNTVTTTNRRHPHYGKSTVDIITSDLYNVSTHQVISKDGYITTIYRIFGGLASPPRAKKQPLILYHGLGGAAASWLVQPGNRNLAYKLVDAGYDVWLPNIRGTKVSQGHLQLNSKKDLNYWNFNIEDVAVKDFPLIIDLILETTKMDKIHYICHSMGCRLYIVALSEMPELNDKMATGVLLAPAIFVGHAYSIPLRLGPKLVPKHVEPFLLKLLGGRVDSNPSEFLTRLGLNIETFCTPPLLRCGLCNNLLSIIYEFDGPQMNYTNFPNMLTKLGDDIPLGYAFHFFQNVRSCAFTKFDYGDKNLEIYGQPMPPAYNIKRVTTPIHIFYGESDSMVTPHDAAQLKDGLRPDVVKTFYKVDWELFHHIDFLMANDADILVYNRVLDILNSTNFTGSNNL